MTRREREILNGVAGMLDRALTLLPPGESADERQTRGWITTALAEVGKLLPAEAYTPRTAADAAVRSDAVWGSRARYEPNVTPPGPGPIPVSDHHAVRVEAWAVATDGDSLRAVEDALAAVPGVISTGHDTKFPARRLFAWAVLAGDGSYCGHTREGWTAGRR